MPVDPQNKAKEDNVFDLTPPKVEEVKETSVEPDDEVLVAPEDVTVKVQLDPDFEYDAEESDVVTVTVASYPDLELSPGRDYEVPAPQAALLVESPAVEVVE